MTAKLWDYEACKEEQKYILSVNPIQPGQSFNNDPECFARYCEMQGNHIKASGYPLIAVDIFQSRDTALCHSKKQKDTHKTLVLFRIFKKELIALFPLIPWDNDTNNCASYQHVGQHGKAHYQSIMGYSRKATHMEYYHLQRELEGLGYNLLIADKSPIGHKDMRQKELDRDYKKAIDDTKSVA